MTIPGEQKPHWLPFISAKVFFERKPVAYCANFFFFIIENIYLLT